MLAVSPGRQPATVVLAPQSVAAEVVGAVTPGYRCVGVTKGQFSLLDLCEALLEQVGPAMLTIATWTPGMSEMERVMGMLDSARLRRFRLLVDRSFPGRHPQYVARVTEICGPGSIVMTRTHAKFALIATEQYRITVRTSMNFNVNPRLEQFDIDDDAEIYALFDGVVDELMERAPGGLGARRSDVERGFKHAFTTPGPVPVKALTSVAFDERWTDPRSAVVKGGC